jgi:hypothetical protein
MKEQFDKWKSGELKRITKDMVKKREALNKSPPLSNASSNIDLEMGVIGHTESARAAALDRLEANKKPSFWQKAKSKVAGKGKSPVCTPESSPETEVDCFFTVDVDAFDQRSSHHVSSQTPRVRYESGNDRVHQPPSPIYSASVYSRPTDVNGSRVFSDHTASDFPKLGRSLRKRVDEPMRYTAYGTYVRDVYGPRQKEHSIHLAEAALKSAQYKEAEHTMQRVSATDTEMRRALSIVNLADQQLNLARHPSLYIEIPPLTNFEDVDIRNEKHPVSD